DIAVVGNTVVVTTADDALHHHAPTLIVEEGSRRAWQLHEQLLQQPMPPLRLEGSLRAVTDHVARRADVPIWIDRRSLELDGVDPDGAIAVQFTGGTLAEALDAILYVAEASFAELDFVATQDGVVITTAENAIDYRATVLLDIAWHIDVPSPYHREERVQDLIDLITSTVGRDSWEVNGGTVGRIAEIDGTLVVTQQIDELRQIQQLLGRLRSFQNERERSSERD
ncbi:MAG: hypothetical protein AAGK78_08115, partial [Planctomycetota bacterium]